MATAKQRLDAPIDSFRGEHAFLSNFAHSEIEYNGIRFLTVEHLFQYRKAIADPDIQERIVRVESPKTAKQLGGKANVKLSWWHAKRLEVMRECLVLKFPMPDYSGPVIVIDLHTVQLLDTGDRLLIEGNVWNDTYWGQCGGRGQNWLGSLLMLRRAELRAAIAEG